MTTPHRRIVTPALLTIAALSIALGAAPQAPAQSTTAELDWATQALERNSALEVVSVDPSAGVITVRVKRTGELRRVRPRDLIAAPGRSGALEPSTGSGSSVAGAARSSPSQAQALEPGERVLASGPGYRITTAESPAVGTGQTGQPPVAGGAELARNLQLERRHDPIICQGPKLVHMDSLDLEFDGNAIAAVDGCELHITNSRIVARGVAVAVRGASVHIDNSAIEGADGALDAGGGAQVYARSSTFRGVIRRSDDAGFHDMGGNVGD